MYITIRDSTYDQIAYRKVVGVFCHEIEEDLPVGRP